MSRVYVWINRITMPETSNILRINYPTQGWSSSWGLRNVPRPGAMTDVYRLGTTGATGTAELLNQGVFMQYNGAGSLDAMGYASPSGMPFSFEPISWVWKPDFTFPQNLVIDITFGLWIEGGFPVEWGKVYTNLTWPTAREAFNLPAPGASPAVDNPGNIPNEITLTPLTDYAVSIWRPPAEAP